MTAQIGGVTIAAVRMWGTQEGNANGTNGMSVGWDMDNLPDTYSLMYFTKTAGWYQHKRNRRPDRS